MNLIIPAIDIINGKCVRLFKGQYDRVKQYDVEPAQMAEYYKKAGARRIHVIDLDGARYGSVKNLEALKKIRETADIEIEFGGGVRTLRDAENIAALGVEHIILGTGFLRNEGALAGFSDALREKVMISLDVSAGYVRVDGWINSSDLSLEEAVHKVEDAGISDIVYTNIDFDGTLKSRTFTDVDANAPIFHSLNVILSGGISTEDNIAQAFSYDFIKGVIIGKAIYEGRLDIEKTLRKWK